MSDPTEPREDGNEAPDHRFREIVAAYRRGFEWCVENGIENEEYLNKAACDYAGKITSPKQ